MVSGCPQHHGEDRLSERGSRWSLEVTGSGLRETRGFMKRRGTPLAAKEIRRPKFSETGVNSRCRWKIIFITRGKGSAITNKIS